MHTMATIGPCSDAEDLLTSIHLERYLNHFRRAGFLLARDFCHVDNAALNRVGVTATGHRKRILKLVEHIQMICQHQRKEPLLDRCNSESDIHEVTPVKSEPLSPSGHSGTSFDALRNRSAPNLCAQVKRSYSERSATVVKPVPKPRTVFHKLREEKLSLPTKQEARPCRKSLQDPCFLIAVDDHSTSSTTPRRDTVKTSTESPQRLAETDGPSPPLPPRLNRGIFPSLKRMSDQDRHSSSTLSTPPDSPSGYQCSPFTNTPGSPPSPPCSGLEMVSNEIYCGTLPDTPRMSWSRSLPVPPPRQEVSPSTENHR